MNSFFIISLIQLFNACLIEKEEEKPICAICWEVCKCCEVRGQVINFSFTCPQCRKNKFHGSCIMRCYSKNNSKCPICRHDISCYKPEISKFLIQRIESLTEAQIILFLEFLGSDFFTQRETMIYLIKEKSKGTSLLISHLLNNPDSIPNHEKLLINLKIAQIIITKSYEKDHVDIIIKKTKKLAFYCANLHSAVEIFDYLFENPEIISKDTLKEFLDFVHNIIYIRYTIQHLPKRIISKILEILVINYSKLNDKMKKRTTFIYSNLSYNNETVLELIKATVQNNCSETIESALVFIYRILFCRNKVVSFEDLLKIYDIFSTEIKNDFYNSFILIYYYINPLDTTPENFIDLLEIHSKHSYELPKKINLYFRAFFVKSLTNLNSDQFDQFLNMASENPKIFKILISFSSYFYSIKNRKYLKQFWMKRIDKGLIFTN